MTITGRNGRFLFIGLLSLLIAFPIFAGNATAQTPSNYYVTVNPTTPDSPMYTSIGNNWTLSFEAIWSHGNNSGQSIKNAVVTIQVSDSKNFVVNSLSLNTTEGLFSFNYSALAANVLTFKPTKLVTQDGVEWTADLVDLGNSVYGFQSKSVVVWWDTLHASLVDFDTKTFGVSKVWVNVTYLLLPEEGLTLPEWATYSNQTFLPKIAHNASVRINGVKAQEASTEGIFSANVSIWLPTSYVHVAVSQDGWVTTKSGFSFAQDANEPLWLVVVIFGLVALAAAVGYFVILRRKSESNGLSRQKGYAFLGGILLVAVSVISLYWGLVGLDSALHGFDWMFLTFFEFVSFGFGIIAGMLSMKRKNQALVIFAVIPPVIANMVGVKVSLEMYQLALPWVILIVSFGLAFVSGILVSNADEAFA